METFIPLPGIRQLYDRFDAPVTAFDCGQKCAPHNPSGKPFCCDICHAVPAAYRPEWEYLQRNTGLWRPWRGDECPSDPGDPAELLADTPDHMLLLACLGPSRCQREFRLISCRQFPFFPYVSSDDRFLGLAYEWEFEGVCWVISHLGEVTGGYREEFVRLYDELFARSQEEFEGYAAKSEELRAYFAARKRRFPLLHRGGGYYLVSPGNERMQRVSPERLRRFGPYRQGSPA
jgi:hypothetical protein